MVSTEERIRRLERQVQRARRSVIVIVAIAVLWVLFVFVLGFLQRFVFPSTPMIFLMLGVAPFFAIVLVVLIIWWRRTKLPPPGHCHKCGYDLTGNTSGRCPECGESIT